MELSSSDKLALRRATVLIKKVMKELGAIDSRGESFVRRAPKIAYAIGFNYFMSAKDELSIERHASVACGALIRANIENLADMLFFLNDAEQSENYVQRGMNKYAEHLKRAFEVKPLYAARRDMTDSLIINPWAGKMATDSETGKTFEPVKIAARVRQARRKGYPNLIAVYSFYSAYTHPNAGILRFRSERHEENFRFRVASMRVDNAVLGLELIRTVLKMWELQSASEEKIEEALAALPKLGVMHHFVYQNAEDGLQARLF